MPPTEESPDRLIVEGSDDLHSVAHLLARHGVDWDSAGARVPLIKHVGGIEELLRLAPVAATASYERVGIVLDADIALMDQWRRLGDRLASVGLVLPVDPDRSGTIVSGVRLGSRFGVWVMPDNTSPGRLEHFLQTLIPDGDSCWAFARNATATARRSGCPITDNLKSAIHAWLAWQAEPGLPFGTALRAQIFRHDSPLALDFVAWFQRLFG